VRNESLAPSAEGCLFFLPRLLALQAFKTELSMIAFIFYSSSPFIMMASTLHSSGDFSFPLFSSKHCMARFRRVMLFFFLFLIAAVIAIRAGLVFFFFSVRCSRRWPFIYLWLDFLPFLTGASASAAFSFSLSPRGTNPALLYCLLPFHDKINNAWVFFFFFFCFLRPKRSQCARLPAPPSFFPLFAAGVERP